MNYAHFHILINHFPIVGNVFLILLLIWALIRKNRELIKLALGFAILVALFGYVTDFAGDKAADYVKELPGFSKDAIKEHAEAADWALDFLYATGAVALVALILFIKNKKSA